MGNWAEITDEISKIYQDNQYKIRQINDVDAVSDKRREALQALFEHTGRNVIVYYSAWLENGRRFSGQSTDFSVNDTDKNSFMTALHKLDQSKGLDLILHTPGGDVAATESLVDYIHALFGQDFRVIVPQLAMSAGTMIALSSKEIVMGKHSSLGPIDPQFNGLPAHGLLEEFEQAKKEVSENPQTAHIWQVILNKYNPTMLGEAKKAIQWSNSMVKQWLEKGMFLDEPDKEEKVTRAIKELADHSVTLAHNRHISVSKALELGLNIKELESDPKLQDLVLTLHHLSVIAAQRGPLIKFVVNHDNRGTFLQGHEN